LLFEDCFPVNSTRVGELPLFIPPVEVVPLDAPCTLLTQVVELGTYLVASKVAAGEIVAVALTVAEPPACPVRVVVIVAVAVVPAATPVTVTNPVLLTTTLPPAVALPDQVKLES
jgi:hypothetical protein